MPAPTPEVDVTSSADGDYHRFAECYREWYRPVVNLCRRVLGDDRDAEAVAQEAFVRVWQRWDRFSDDRPFGPWVATIARRLCINEAVAEGRRARLADAIAAEAPSSDAEVDRVVLAQAVRRALGRLSRRE
ncbi:MAG: sigma-70 family RNA polymerase sigma factor, partial [Actinomycetota bacterium]|nr:sigma-70 family RNA polymerase sigma factor [Actinomycetota bacterium]